MSHPPPPSVLAGFGLTGTPIPLSGGRGLCFRIANTVLRPCDDASESQYLSDLTKSLLALNPTSYRLAKPLPSVSDPSQFIISSWTASSYLPGKPSLSHFTLLFHAVSAFHADLATLVSVQPPILDTRAANRFTEADKVTWGEKPLSAVDKVNADMLSQLEPILSRLEAAMRPLPTEEEEPRLRKQLVHLDLLGNVLVDDSEEGENPPGIIDLSLYWRPAVYAIAVVVADGLTRLEEDEKKKLVDLFFRRLGEVSVKREVGVELLLRALYWRYLTFAIDPDLEWIKVNLPEADYEGAANTLCVLAVRP
ncbi:hypothetical protein QBC34DRAFT_471489 [Podospora aff. communis PSN243]|uniref:Aminoglycoside phosphotransferase domain-containing protein n=1 Tax=Podospora aff. communis PSN243 TaxID=3040156 RepID=A0AAV9GBB4_9PEZI|nr:hypothetical protein QBC34DRAFT_471489 [Podospora aff. communis PSN243]